MMLYDANNLQCPSDDNSPVCDVQGKVYLIESKNCRLATPVIRLLFRLLAVTRQGLLIQADVWLPLRAWHWWVFQTEEKYYGQD